jgi:integrase
MGKIGSGDGAMARIRKRGKSWHVEVRKIGHEPERACFPTKREADLWAEDTERRMRQGVQTAYRKTLGDLLEEYARKVTPKKRSAEWELRRIGWLLRSGIAPLPLSELTAAKLSAWRDARLNDVSGETIRRDMNLLSHAINIAIREWGWLTENPLKRVSRPAGNPPRERVASDEEIERICVAGGYQVGTPPETATARTAACAVFAVETGMRSGEIIGIRSESVRDASVRLPKTKNGTARDVPLSDRAKQVLRDVRGDFGLTASQRDSLWRKIAKRAAIEGLTFHDLRHTAITRLARKLNPLELARMVGHKDLKMLLRYYNESAEEIAKRLG